MKLRYRFLLAISTIVIGGACLVLHWILEDVKPRYREAVEETLNDTAQLLACSLEQNLGTEPSSLDTRSLETTMKRVGRRKLDAHIYGLVKRRVDLQIYVTDATGTIIYDSAGGRRVGQDYSRWNDVYLTLRGRYGVRTTRAVEDDPSTSAMYVAAPIYDQQGILQGVLTVIKPVDAVLMFMQTARDRIMVTAVIALVAILLLVGILTVWVTRPLQRLTAFAHAVSTGERAPLPSFGSGEIATLARTIDEMREALEGKQYVEQYVQALSHEMKAPLAAIVGAAELLDEEMAVADRHRFLGNIRQESKRLQDIVDRMLLLASLESRRALRSIEEIDLAALCDELLSSFAPRAAQQGVVMERQGVSATLSGERFLIRHALANVVQNALDFTPADGRVSLTISTDQMGTTVTVSDTGSGIPAFALDKVFERFYSLERPDTGRKSSGLGLAFVREVVDLHGGQVELINGEDGGAIARLHFPPTVSFPL